MHFSTLAAILAVSFTSSAASPISNAVPSDSIFKRDCWAHGAKWGGDRQLAKTNAAVASELFAGCFAPVQSKSACYNISSLKKADFTLQLRDDVDPRCIDPAEAFDGLQKEIDNCGKGGLTTYGNWKYRSDPNNGQCGPTPAPPA